MRALQHSASLGSAGGLSAMALALASGAEPPSSLPLLRGKKVMRCVTSLDL
jgi:hypothetical protein